MLKIYISYQVQTRQTDMGGATAGTRGTGPSLSKNSGVQYPAIDEARSILRVYKAIRHIKRITT